MTLRVMIPPVLLFLACTAIAAAKLTERLLFKVGVK